MKNITIGGNVTKDAEMRNTQNGAKVAGFSIAVNGFANGGKTVDFFEVSIWGKRADNVMQFAKKGAKMCVTGDFGTREHNGKTYLTVNASDFTPMGGGQSDGYQQPSGGDNYRDKQPAGGDDDGDFIPF